MNDEDRITRALNGLADIAKRNEAEKEEERKLQKEKEERRKRLYKLYYEQASPISLIIPKDSIWRIIRSAKDVKKQLEEFIGNK